MKPTVGMLIQKLHLEEKYITDLNPENVAQWVTEAVNRGEIPSEDAPGYIELADVLYSRRETPDRVN